MSSHSLFFSSFAQNSQSSINPEWDWQAPNDEGEEGKETEREGEEEKEEEGGGEERGRERQEEKPAFKYLRKSKLFYFHKLFAPIHWGKKKKTGSGQ